MSARTCQPSQPPAWVVEEWQSVYLRVKGAVVAERLWTRILTPGERERLGGELDAAYRKYGGAAGMWLRLRGVSEPQAVLGVGVALNLVDPLAAKALLRALGEDPEGSLDRAIASGGLVLAESPRRMWWLAKQVKIDWRKRERAWGILDGLARETKGGAVLDRWRIDSGTRDPGFLKKAISKIIHLGGFPEDLGKKIRSVGRNTYQFDLPPQSIRVFECGTGDELKEWLP